MKSKNHGITPTPNLPTLKAYPTLREVVGSIFFFAKMKGKDELKGMWSNFTPWLCVFEYQGENCLGVVVATPLRRTRVKTRIWSWLRVGSYNVWPVWLQNICHSVSLCRWNFLEVHQSCTHGLEVKDSTSLLYKHYTNLCMIKLWEGSALILMKSSRSYNFAWL